jgi:hypothetical protein
VGKVISRPFQRYITRPNKFENYSCKKEKKRKICSRLATVDQGGEKNCNGKNIAVLFCIFFYYTKYDI